MPSLNFSLIQFSDKKIFWFFSAICILSFNLAIILKSPVPALLPFGLIFALFTINSVKHLYYVFFFLLPFSIEIELPGGFGTDIPSEPIMIILMGLSLILLIQKASLVDKRIFTHPITLIIALHISWIAITSIFSTNSFISVKYLMAKLWYVVPFYFLPLLIFKDEKDIRPIFKMLSLGLFIAISFVMLQHASLGFTFDSINKAVRPIFRNHVNYAIMLLAFLPFLSYLLVSSKKKGILKYLLLVYLLVAIYLTFTRAAQAASVMAIGVYFVIRWRLMKYAVGAALIALVASVLFLTTENKYLDFAPNFEKTIEHKNFDNLVEATAKMEDISTVERFYRWVAGFYMVDKKPLLGHGPSTFYTQYKAYTVTSYKTYVSDNPEKSGIHNNYLMVAVEQGIPGLIIILMLALLPLIVAEQIYHKMKKSKDRTLLVSAAICYALINIVILINDLLEADKIGPFYFLSASIIVLFSLNIDRDKSAITE